ncbi:diguanylate cyclase domain-containing protein [Phytobacter sp. V91]|uniref:diguanylate cyclase domain-containing protein n=1 Tax=Phytobacter sp. V91 TaxID=3369425 RepID=UPI003F5E48A8
MLYVSWDPILIGISFVVAFIASFVALDSATKICSSDLRSALFWRICGGATLGMGIWSMHFVGMLAMKMPIVMHYDIMLTIASFWVSLIAATLAINVAVSREKLPLSRLLLATCILSSGAVVMHSLGMLALTDYLVLYWNKTRLFFAIVIAFLASGLALWLAFGRKTNRHRTYINHVLAALVMGMTICSMHYLAMSAVEFSNTKEGTGIILHGSARTAMHSSVSETGLSIWVSTSTLIVLGIMLFISLIDSQLRTSRLTESLRQLNMQLEKQAWFDPLTHLPNRIQFDNRLDECLASAIEQRQRFALLFMDLDRFKQVNDMWGHHIGDLLLKSVAIRLKQCITEEMTLARLGGDEFILLVPDKNDDEVTTLARRLVDSIQAPFYEAGHVISVSLSVGISFFPSHGDTSQDLKFKADAAMYNVKQNGRNGWEIWHPTMQHIAANTPVYLSDLPAGQ